MGTQEDIFNLLQQIEGDLIALPRKLMLAPDQIKIATGLSDISENLGMLMAGEFRSGNQKDPGFGFSGMRMAYPSMTYDLSGVPTQWNLVGIENDVLQFGVRASDGKLIAGGGSVVLSSTGISAIAGAIGGWTINTTTITGSDITLDSSGSIRAGFAAGASGWEIYSNGAAEFNNVTVRGEIKSAVFTYDAVQALAGSMGVFKSAGVLRTDAIVPADATAFFMDIQDPAYGHFQLFAVNDFLRVKYGAISTWFKVTVVTDMTSWWRYTVAKQSGTASYTIKAGTPVVDYGPANYGFLWMTSDDTNGPFYSVRTHAGVPWTTITEHVRMGNLNGNWGYAAATYGMALGEYAANKPNITIDPTNGLRIRNYTTTVLQFDVTGNAIISNKLLMNQALYGLNADVQQAYIDATGRLLAGGGSVVLDSVGINLSSSRIRFANVAGDYTKIYITSGAADQLALWNRTLGGVMKFGIQQTDGGTPYMQWYEVSTNQPRLDIFGALWVRDYIITQGYIQIAELASSPATPSNLWGILYAKTDNNLYFKNDAGVESKLSPTSATPAANTIPIADAAGKLANAWLHTVAARYTTNAAQSIPNNTLTIINFEDITFDTHTAVTIGAAWKFTCPTGQAGYYRISAYILFAASDTWAAGELVSIYLYKNGARVSTLYYVVAESATNMYREASGSDVVLLAAGDYIDIRGVQVSGGALALNADGVYNYVAITKT